MAKTEMKIQKRRLMNQVPVDWITIPRHIALILEKNKVFKLNVTYNEETGIVECIPIMELNEN